MQVRRLAFLSALGNYVTAIADDYANWCKPQNDAFRDEIRAKMNAEFFTGLHVEYGKKFAKVVSTMNSGSSVHSFVVLKKTDKFEVGDVLKAASWAAPAKNFKRGSIFDTKFNWVRWTGV